MVVSVTGEGLVERVHELTGGRGAYAAIECVGGELFAKVRGKARAVVWKQGAGSLQIGSACL